MATETNENGAVAGDEQDERRPTERVILERMVAIRIPEDASEEQVQAAVEALYAKARKSDRAGAVGEAWSEVARKVGTSKKAAIEAFAGKPGTADARVGQWRAPSVTAWKGGVRHERPPAPLIQAEMFE